MDRVAAAAGATAAAVFVLALAMKWRRDARSQRKLVTDARMEAVNARRMLDHP
ncbi:MAG: hypothetical protein R2724_18955 [Bryobacterales bacterium]